MSDLGGEFINIKARGVLAHPAVGDGRANDAQAFRDAISRAGMIAGGATIWFPPGKYKLEGDIPPVPAHVTLKFSNGASLLLSNPGPTLTIEGAIDAGLWQLISVPNPRKIP